MSLCHYYFVLFAWRTFRREHIQLLALIRTLPPQPVCVCVRKNCIEYYDEGKIFLFNLFSLSLLFAEKPKSGEKILVFLSQHTKLFALILHFLSRNNPFLSCFQTHFPNPVRKTFFSH